MEAKTFATPVGSGAYPSSGDEECDVAVVPPKPSGHGHVGKKAFFCVVVGDYDA